MSAAAAAAAPPLQSRNSCCCFLRSSTRPTRNISRSLSFCFSISAVGGQSQWAKAHKFERNPAKYWDEFYQRHRNKFFKDRHYLEKDWGHCFISDSSTEIGETSVSTKIVLEVGCGAGNSLFPLMAAFPNVFVHACDFSPHAISLIKAHEAYRSNRVNAFVCDLTVDDLCKMIMPASIDVLTMIFMLSAVPPSMMPSVLHNAKNVLKPNGYLLFRDYAIGDYAQVTWRLLRRRSRCRPQRQTMREAEDAVSLVGVVRDGVKPGRATTKALRQSPLVMHDGEAASDTATAARARQQCRDVDRRERRAVRGKDKAKQAWSTFSGETCQ